MAKAPGYGRTRVHVPRENVRPG
eukprot:COSAG03_NODE_24076_length_275_cov_0.573864_1_plen_22_part_01